jgi:phenylacetate-CoA ligase
MFDLYGTLLGRYLFPAFEAARGRPTVALLRHLEATQWWSLEQLRDLQLGYLRRLLRHAYRHTSYYRRLFDEHGVVPDRVQSVADLPSIPLLTRDLAQTSFEGRLASAPPEVAVRKASSGTTGQPMVVAYNAESRHFRDATRWRGYGWAGYRIGMRAMHYWAAPLSSTPRWARFKAEVDHRLKRDLYIDSSPRGEQALAAAVSALRKFRPEIIVGYSQGMAALARFVIQERLRTWDSIPVLCGAERVLPHDREVMLEAFGDVFETYGCREVMLIASECEHHEGMHTSMETMIVELVVRNPDGTARPAKPGESGEVVVTDLHNLSNPLIRYLNGDLAVARAEEICKCGRALPRIGPIEGRVTDTLYDGQGRAVSGLLFNILFVPLADAATQFQVVQRRDRSILLRLVPKGGRLAPQAEKTAREFVAQYLPGCKLEIDLVDDIPTTAAGKRRLVVVEKD